MNGLTNQPKGWETPKNAHLAEALKLARLGFRVIPLRERDKQPLIEDWPNKATWDEATIRGWWAKWPNANIGIATGRYRDGYFCVLDFDPRNGGVWYDDAPKDVLPPTWVVHTGGGGRHYYYKTPKLLRCAKLGGGVDLKGDGGYVVAPPSVHPNGERYGWGIGAGPGGIPIAEVPEWVLRGLAGEGQSAGESKEGVRLSLWLMPPPIPKGMRHDYLVSLAGALLAAGLSEREIEAVLWGAIELLETREDFDPVAEIKGILKGLPRWEGETYTIGSLLRMLPERTAAVVRRVLTAGAVGGSAESNGVVGGQSEGVQSEKADAETPHPPEAVGGAPQTDVGEGKVKADGGGKDRFQAARDIVRAFEIRQRGDGSFCYVYRTPDGNELETASCDPKAVKDFLERLGLNIPLKDVRALLGLSKEASAGEGEGKSKKRRKAETAELEDIKAVLWRYKWVRWQGEVWQVVGSKIYKADLDRIHGVLKRNGVEVGKETLKSYWSEITTSLPKSILRGIVVTPEPTYGRVGALRGLWYRHFGDLYLETPTETRIFPEGQWPEGVYAIDTGDEGILPDPNGEPKHTLGYWEGITSRLAEDKRIPREKLQRVTLAMFLPILFGQGHIGLILYGAARSGKSTLLKALGYLRLGRKPRSPSGLNKRDLLAVLQRRQIVFFDEVKTITPELEEALKRMITHDGDEIRALYTNLETVEADLQGSAIFCATSLSQLASDLRTRCFVWHLEEKEGSLYEQDILDFCEALWRLALGGAIKLYRMAARLKRPPNNLLPEIRFRDWLSWAYRYAVVLEVEKEFVDFVKQAKSAAHSGGKYDFLLDLLAQPDFDTSREYTITDLIALVAPTDDATGSDADEAKAQAIRAAKALQYALKSEAVRADLIAMARDMGYNLRIEKKRVKGEKKPKYRFIFSRLEIPHESDRLRAILQRLGIEPDWGADWDGEGAPMAEPIPQDGHAPIPEVLGDRVGIAPQTLDTYLKATDGIRELPLHIEETAKAVKRLAELFTALSQSEVKPLRQLSLYLRGLQALTYAEIGAYNGAILYLGGTPKHTSPTPKEGLAVLRQVIREIEGSLNGEEVALAPLPIPPQSGGRIALPTPPTPEIAEKHRAIEEIRRAIRELERAVKGDDPNDPDPIPPSPTPNLPPREGEPKWEYVTDASQLPEIEERLQREDAVGWDLETVGNPGAIAGALHPATGRARLFSLYLPSIHTAYLIDLDRVPEAWGLLAKAKKIVGHNLTFDLTFAAANGAYIANPKERLWDTLIAEKLLYCKEYSEPRHFSLKELASKLGIRLNKEHQTANWGGSLTDEMLRYAAMDAYAAYMVYLSQRERIAEAGLGRAMAIEMGALPAIAAMRAWGVGVDGDAVKREWEALRAEMERLEKELEPYGRAVMPELNLGQRLNWNRLDLIKDVLYSQGLPWDQTNEAALAPYKSHPFVAALLKWREVKKRKELLAELLTPLKEDGRIYADWDPLGAGTGRMTCKTPNLQQTPHELRAYIKPREGHVLIKADFSQIELRIAAAVAKDQRMLQAFRDGTDLHRLTASLILSKPLDEVSKEERQMAKALNFGLLYGMGAKGLKTYALSQYGVSLSPEQAKEYREKFFATYPGLAQWHRETDRALREAENRRERGIVVHTLAGRKRLVDSLTAALNTPIQGTGADGLKAAVALYYKWLLERGLWGQVRIVLLVHDEIVVEAPEPLALEAADLLTKAMREGMAAIVKGVPIEVEAGIYADWGQTPHPLSKAWEYFAKIPESHPVREAILKGEAPDPERDGEYLTTYMIIRAILNGENIEPPF